MNMSENEDETLDSEDGYTLDSSEQKARIARRKKRQIESEDFTVSPEEAERRKRNAEPTETQ